MLTSPSPFWLSAGGLLGLTAVAAMAVGAHVAEGALAQELIQQAGNMQLFHALLLIVLYDKAGRWIGYSRWLVVLGVLLFCGSLYAKAFLALAHAPLAPFGGSCMMLGWLMLIVQGVASRKN